jgi:AraC-like DNA-binding protein
MGLSKRYEPIHDLAPLTASGQANRLPDIEIRLVTFDRCSIRMPVCANRQELCFLETGHLTFQFADRSAMAHPGDLAVLKTLGGCIAKACSPSGSKALLLRFSPTLVAAGNEGPETALYLAAFHDSSNRLPHVIKAESPVAGEISGFLRQLRRELPDTSSLGRLATETYLRMILYLIARHYETGRQPGTADHERMRKLVRLKPLFSFVDRSYHEQITVEQAALILGLSRSHFMRCFRSASGESFLSWLNRYRIAKAKLLLASTDKTILTISEEVGFSDQSHFGQLFRRFINMTPRQYRESRSARNRR